MGVRAFPFDREQEELRLLAPAVTRTRPLSSSYHRFPSHDGSSVLLDLLQWSEDPSPKANDGGEPRPIAGRNSSSNPINIYDQEYLQWLGITRFPRCSSAPSLFSSSTRNEAASQTSPQSSESKYYPSIRPRLRNYWTPSDNLKRRAKEIGSVTAQKLCKFGSISKRSATFRIHKMAKKFKPPTPPNVEPVAICKLVPDDSRSQQPSEQRPGVVGERLGAIVTHPPIPIRRKRMRDLKKHATNIRDLKRNRREARNSESIRNDDGDIYSRNNSYFLRHNEMYPKITYHRGCSCTCLVHQTSTNLSMPTRDPFCTCALVKDRIRSSGYPTPLPGDGTLRSSLSVPMLPPGSTITWDGEPCPVHGQSQNGTLPYPGQPRAASVYDLSRIPPPVPPPPAMYSTLPMLPQFALQQAIQYPSTLTLGGRVSGPMSLPPPSVGRRSSASQYYPAPPIPPRGATLPPPPRPLPYPSEAYGHHTLPHKRTIHSPPPGSLKAPSVIIAKSSHKGSIAESHRRKKKKMACFKGSFLVLWIIVGVIFGFVLIAVILSFIFP
ncbi:unnamed protein product [Cyprideis torosa]|uniref:Uncharacterized protein n=1 Tax=Cyprideis torosa TaxID=163714 RepID=A0A7R8ZFN3_9CRUS|nr:unnamed protein product [Cyprideis torosa]CAG0879536.1 unnamed protein product [Cyprideis torosa]